MFEVDVRAISRICQLGRRIRLGRQERFDRSDLKVQQRRNCMRRPFALTKRRRQLPA
jgi:hypothetical protein